MNLRRYAYAGTLAGMLAMGVTAFAQTPPKKPANATAECTDGTTAKTKTGACSKHGGVKTWFGAADTGKQDATAKNTTAKTTTATTDTTTKTGTAAAATAGAPPAGSTGQCTDGSYTKAKTQTGACSSHGGVKTWFAADTKTSTGTTTPAAAATSTTAAPKGPPPPPPVPGPVSTATGASTTGGTATKSGGAKSTSSSGKAPTVAPPAGTPDNATAKCRDNTYSFAKTHTGACSNHGGVAEWYK